MSSVAPDRGVRSSMTEYRAPGFDELQLDVLGRPSIYRVLGVGDSPREPADKTIVRYLVAVPVEDASS
jgi:hypothetical protein